MRNKIKKRPIILAAAALGLTISLSVGGALAYFTTYSTASGSALLDIGFTETSIEENVENGVKSVVVANIGDYSCFVRARIFAAEGMTGNISGEGWSDGGDGYWYFNSVVAAGAKTNALNININYPTNEGEDKVEDFNVIVVQECTPVVYSETGDPIADWNQVYTDSQE
ncbi:MAG: hypothetical protein EOM40_09465 [Clostridia bacterium]|nr:hypothetical protein [Clostridia bacterium]NCC42397.1 hypothetical protein [Clostridia bacterium]